MKGTAIYHSPFGKMQLDWEDGAVTALRLARDGLCEGTPNALTARVFRQLDEYFSGTRRTFDFPCCPHGTPFQQRVWAALRDIPYGETRSYKQLAEAIGRHGESREPHPHRHPLPPRHLRGRLAGRLRRRRGDEKGAAAARAGGRSMTCGSSGGCPDYSFGFKRLKGVIS